MALEKLEKADPLRRLQRIDQTPGFWWVNPLTTRRRLSLRVRNFESGKLKVNDHDGNPIEIAAVVVWRISRRHAAAATGDGGHCGASKDRRGRRGHG